MNAPRCERHGCKNPAAHDRGGPCAWHRHQDWKLAKGWQTYTDADHDLESGLPEPPTADEIAAAKAEILRQRMTRHSTTPGGPNVLVLSMRPSERILIGDNVILTVVGIVGDKVKIGISAPQGVKVDREEVRDRDRPDYGRERGTR